MNKPVETPLGVQAVGEAASKTHVLGTILASESRAAGTHNGPELKNYQHAGVRLFVNVTDVGAAGTVTVKVQVKDPVSGTWIDLPDAVTTALAATGLAMLTILPGLTEAANEDIDAHLGLTWRVVATVAANAVTCSVGGEYLCH